MNLIFSLDEHYIPPLKVLLYTLFETNKQESCMVYLLHDNIPSQKLAGVSRLIKAYGHRFIPIRCKDLLPDQAEWAISRYYSVEMYYWLLAPFLLPEKVERGLYLDPDIICLNRLDSFYHGSFDGFLFKAASHNYLTKWLKPFNSLRLQTESSDGYYNAGVVLMDLKTIRKVSSIKEIVTSIEENKNKLILPDQDIFNLLFSDRIEEVDWREYNLPPLVYEFMQRLFPERYSDEWLTEEVKLVHFMGKNKPWKERGDYKYELGKFYFEAERQMNSQFPELFASSSPKEKNQDRKKDGYDEAF